jgi:hypothetical protein
MKHLKETSLHDNFFYVEEAFTRIENSKFEMLFLFDVASHFNLTFDKLTYSEAISKRSMYKDILPEERWKYWESWAYSSHPSSGLVFLKDSGWLELFPELFLLVGVMQNPETHPEGDVFTHSALSVNVASEICERDNLNHEDRLVLIFSALCHDIGKYISLTNHEKLGVNPTIGFMRSIGAPDNIIDRVVKLVEFHGSDYIFLNKPVSVDDIDENFVSKLQTLLLPASIPELVNVSECDINGRKDNKGNVLNLPYELRITEGFRKILNVYKNKKDFFNNSNIINMENDKILEINDVRPGFPQYVFKRNVNDLIKGGYLNENESESIIGYTFSSSYREAVYYCLTLDYRSRKIISEFINENNSDLDTLLLKGRLEIEKILNHSEL